MAEAFVEQGIGETRAIVVGMSEIVEAHIERDDDGWRAGDVRRVRLTRILTPGVRGIVAADQVEALLTPLPRSLTEGQALTVVVVREALLETGRLRLAKVQVSADPTGAGPTLVERLRSRGFAVRTAPPRYFEQLGWSETIDAALTGRVDFTGGSLTISLTPAMTVIDVDGDQPAVPLALAAADAAAAQIRRFDLTGSIGIDFPTVDNKAARTAIGARLDAALPTPFERTAVNGFGFVQIVRPRQRPSLMEILRASQVTTSALILLRQAEQEGFGAADLVASAAVIDWLAQRPLWQDELARRRGGSINLRIDPTLPISSGYVTSANSARVRPVQQAADPG